ncbi:MAG: hypothetical protein IJY50_01210 [Clostridia bacterium]|nr:hypothetical protein [Clostridia bacterium]
MDGNLTTPGPTGTGYLVVQVTTASNAIPLSDAAVTVRESEGGTVLYELRSAGDGRTDRVALTAPPRAQSQRPSAALPYAVYNIEVRLNGYENAFYQNVPIFDGITAIQQANLRPIPENGYPDGFTLNDGQQFEGEEHQLRGEV